MTDKRLSKIVDKALTDILKVEGGYVNDPNDPGGETNFGITVAVARDNGYDGSMKSMPVAIAKNIYLKEYWVSPQFDLLAKINPEIALEVFDTGVNCGTRTAVKFLQRALNSLNRGGDIYPDLDVDGVAGSGTREALRGYLHYRVGEGELVLLTALNALQAVYYIELAERREKSEQFLFGWLRKRVQL